MLALAYKPTAQHGTVTPQHHDITHTRLTALCPGLPG